MPETISRSVRRVALAVAALLLGPLAVPSTAPAAAMGALPAVAGAPAAATAPSALAPGEQWRGYWVDAFNSGIYTSAQVDALVADAQQVRANALIVQIARRFDCFCNDAIFPRTGAAISALPYDPLATLVTKAHAAGLEVHAWVNATTLWNSATAPTAPDHAYNTHGPSASGANRWLNKRVDGVEIVSNSTYLDPANPAAVDYVVDAIASITENYDVDGVNLDYIRYPDYNSGTANDWGYSTTSLARFRAETGRTDTPAPSDAQFTAWRRDQVTALVRKVYLRMYEVDPTDRLSVNGITYGYGPQSTGGWETTSAYRSVLQDWRGWTEEGIVDTVATMNYKREHLADQAQMFAEWTEATADYQGDRQNVVGPALYLNTIDNSVAQAEAVVASGAAGWSGYSYANVSATAAASTSATVKAAERTALEQALTSEVFTGPASVPVMPWKASPTTGHLAGTVVDEDGRPLDQIDVEIRPQGSTAPAEIRTARTDGSGWFAVVDLAPGRYVVRVSEDDVDACDVAAVVTVGGIADAAVTTGPCVAVFADVPPGAAFYDDIMWLWTEGITRGWTAPDGTLQFGASDPIRREAMAAFLYRAMGEPAFVPPTTSPFADLNPGDAFYAEITWLAAEGIAPGAGSPGGASTFRPTDLVTREVMALWIFRTVGDPGYAAPETSPFVDVPTSHPSYREIAWMGETGVSTGVPLDAGGFAYVPGDDVTREAMAAFLHRAVLL